MEGAQQSVEEIICELFKDFNGRRAGIIKAVTTDARKLHELCDPENANLCLYGLPDGTWDVDLPAEALPPDLPEPVLGINFARDGMQEKDWLELLAINSDSWLVSVAFYFACFNLKKNERETLFEMINELPTIYEVLKRSFKPSRDQYGAPQDNRSKKKTSGTARFSESGHKGANGKASSREEGEDDDGATCGVCGDYSSGEDGEFWICCDACEKWFHGKCVKVTPAKAQYINMYVCPLCSGKQVRV